MRGINRRLRLIEEKLNPKKDFLKKELLRYMEHPEAFADDYIEGIAAELYRLDRDFRDAMDSLTDEQIARLEAEL